MTTLLQLGVHRTKQISKKWAFQQWLLRPRYRHGVFATEYCRLFALKKAYKGGSRAPEDPPSYALGLDSLFMITELYCDEKQYLAL